MYTLIIDHLEPGFLCEYAVVPKRHPAQKRLAEATFHHKLDHRGFISNDNNTRTIYITNTYLKPRFLCEYTFVPKRYSTQKWLAEATLHRKLDHLAFREPVVKDVKRDPGVFALLGDGPECSANCLFRKVVRNPLPKDLCKYSREACMNEQCACVVCARACTAWQ